MYPLFFCPKHEAKHKCKYTDRKEKNEKTNPAALSIRTRLGGIVNKIDTTKEIKMVTMFYCVLGSIRTRKMSLLLNIDMLKTHLRSFGIPNDAPSTLFNIGNNCVLLIYKFAHLSESSVRRTFNRFH